MFSDSCILKFAHGSRCMYSPCCKISKELTKLGICKAHPDYLLILLLSIVPNIALWYVSYHEPCYDHCYFRFYDVSDESTYEYVWMLSRATCDLDVLVSHWGGLLSCLSVFVHIVKGSCATNPFDIQSFYYHFKKCMYVVINYQKWGEWKCNHALNLILMLMTTCIYGTNHVYQVYLRIMSQRPCVDHD